MLGQSCAEDSRWIKMLFIVYLLGVAFANKDVWSAGSMLKTDFMKVFITSTCFIMLSYLERAELHSLQT